MRDPNHSQTNRRGQDVRLVQVPSSVKSPGQEAVLQKPTDGLGRAQDEPRAARRLSLITRFNRRTATAAHSLRIGFRDRSASPAALLSEMLASALRPYTKAERTLPIVVAAIVGISSLLVLVPASPSAAALGTQGSDTGGVRIAVGGGMRYQTSVDGPSVAGIDGGQVDGPSFQPVSLPGETSGADATQAPVPDQVLSDGTLVTGYAPATAVEDGSSLITTYRVRSGDTLSSIARKAKISMMTLWWANKLASKDSLHVGQVLRVPTADGLIVTVTTNDTLESLAAHYKVDAAEIVTLNELADPILVVGQVLIMPGARGKPIPTPKPVPVSKPHYASGGSASGLTNHYTGGRLRWPVIGGNNYISQYYHGVHLAIDIAAQTGSPVVAAAAGRVVFAGWRNNGGGWQVWLSNGSNLGTGYYHMSAITVAVGQYVARGQQIGRVGMTGHATGPHLHFEVWVGQVDNGYRVNPMRYL